METKPFKVELEHLSLGCRTYPSLLDICKESLNKLIPFMVRRPKEVPVVQAHHERNQPLTVRPELVEGLIQRCYVTVTTLLF